MLRLAGFAAAKAWRLDPVSAAAANAPAPDLRTARRERRMLLARASNVSIIVSSVFSATSVLGRAAFRAFERSLFELSLDALEIGKRTARIAIGFDASRRDADFHRQIAAETD